MSDLHNRFFQAAHRLANPYYDRALTCWQNFEPVGQSAALLHQGLGQAAVHYAEAQSLEATFVGLLPAVLASTKSPFGFLAEVRYRGEVPFLHSHAVTDIYKPDYGPQDIRSNLQFHNLDTLNGAVMLEKKIVLTNEPPNDPRSSGVPFGHTELTAYLGQPFLLGDKLYGACALGNRPFGYTPHQVKLLEPLAQIGGLLIAADRHR